MSHLKILKNTCNGFTFRYTCFIWFLNGDEQLSTRVRNLIKEASNKCYLSITSIWEIAIKISLQKLQIKGDFDKIAIFLTENDITLLPISFEHLLELTHLEFHHKDSFDRILIAQAQCEDFTVATIDTSFDLYSLKTVWK